MFISQAWQDLLFPGNAEDFFTRVAMPPFNPNTQGYSRDNARWLMELSRLVYRHDAKEGAPIPNPTLDDFLTKANFTKREFFLDKATDTQAMLIETAGTLPYAVLVFRGTEQTPRDMLTDVEVGRFPLDENSRDVHDGFQKAFDSIWDDVETALGQLPASQPLFFTGHSLGAALATLAAEKLKPTAVYTFGSPRVGNQKFVDALEGIPIYRVVDDQDTVTTAPPEAMGFRHVGELHQLSDPGKPGNRFFAPPKPLADHAPVNYLDRI